MLGVHLGAANTDISAGDDGATIEPMDVARAARDVVKRAEIYVLLDDWSRTVKDALTGQPDAVVRIRIMASLPLSAGRGSGDLSLHRSLLRGPAGQRLDTAPVTMEKATPEPTSLIARANWGDGIVENASVTSDGAGAERGTDRASTPMLEPATFISPTPTSARRSISRFRLLHVSRG